MTLPARCCAGGRYRLISAAGTQAAANQLHGAAAIDRRDRLTDRRAPHRYIDAHRSHRSKRAPEIAVLHHFTNNTQCAKNPGLIRSATTFLTFCSRNVLQHGTKHISYTRNVKQHTCWFYYADQEKVANKRIRVMKK